MAACFDLLTGYPQATHILYGT